MLKTSRHIVEATKMGLQRMTTYVSSSSKRMQIGDFIFPDDEVPPRVKNQESYKNIIKLFNELSEAIKDALNQTIEEQKQQLKSQLQKKEVNKKGGVNKLEEEKVEAKAKENLHVEAEKREEIQQEENERNLQKESKELKKDSDTEKNKDGRNLKGKPERIEEKQGDGNESGITQAHKTGELPEITVKEQLEEETRRRIERSNQELQEALKETNRLLHERTEELQNVKGVLEKLLKEKEGKQKLENGFVVGYGKTQADNTEKLTEEGGDVETKTRQLQGKEKQNLSEKTEDLHNSEASEKQWLNNEKAEKMDEKETTEESRKEQTRSLEKSRSHQTKTWLIEHTLNEDESRILREKMTQLYDATCKDLEADIFKLLDQLQYNEIKKHEIFRGSVASKMKIINQLLGEANEAVDAEYKELISLLEEERARLQKILNSPTPHEDLYLQSTLKKIEDVIKNTKQLEDDVNKFQGNKKDRKFLDLEHKLLNNVMKLDVIQARGRDTIRKKKDHSIKYVTNCMEKLDANVVEGA